MRKLFICYCVLVIASCSDDSNQVFDENDDRVLPFLSFNTVEDLNSYVTSWASGRTENARQIAAVPGFESIEELYTRIKIDLNNAASRESYLGILHSNRDIVFLTADSTVEPVMENRHYRIIANRQGIYQAQGQVHKVIDNKSIVIAAPVHLDGLIKIGSNSTIDSDTYTKVVYAQSHLDTRHGRTSAWPCAQDDFIQLTYLHDPSGCQNDRQTWLTVQTYFVVVGNTRTPWFHAWADSKRRNVVCNWNYYDTSYKTKDAAFHIRYDINNPVHVYYTTAEIPDYNEGNGNELVHEIVWDQLGPTEVLPIPLVATIYFVWAHIAASSRGIGFNNWITVDCN